MYQGAHPSPDGHRSQAEAPLTYPSPCLLRPSILQVLLLELGSPADFLARAVEPPPPKMLRAALRNLYDLQVRWWYCCFACTARLAILLL